MLRPAGLVEAQAGVQPHHVGNLRTATGVSKLFLFMRPVAGHGVGRGIRACATGRARTRGRRRRGRRRGRRAGRTARKMKPGKHRYPSKGHCKMREIVKSSNLIGVCASRYRPWSGECSSRNSNTHAQRHGLCSRSMTRSAPCMRTQRRPRTSTSTQGSSVH